MSEFQRMLVSLRRLLCNTATVMKFEENPDETWQSTLEGASSSHKAVAAVSLQHGVRWRIPRNSAFAETMCDRVPMTRMMMK